MTFPLHFDLHEHCIAGVKVKFMWDSTVSKHNVEIVDKEAFDSCTVTRTVQDIQ